MENSVIVYLMLGFLILSSIAALLAIKSMRRDITELKYKAHDSETLLFDIRDGKKTFFKEKRDTVRLHGEIKAKLTIGNSEEDVNVLNIGYNGVMLRTKSPFKEGDSLSLKIYLPLFPQPVNVRLRVVRSISHQSYHGTQYDLGAEYIALGPDERSKIIETIDVLSRGQK